MMAPEKKHASDAERQAAYRRRRQEQQEQLLRAVVAVANPQAPVHERLEAARLLWRMIRQPPETAPEVIAMLVNHVNVVLAGFATDPAVGVPSDWQGEFTAILAATSAWLLEYRAIQHREGARREGES